MPKVDVCNNSSKFRNVTFGCAANYYLNYIYITIIFLQDIKLWVVKCHGCEEIAESVQQKSEITMMGTVKHKD